ncbi:MAG: hypothetical protein ACE5EG_03135 [Thermoanaerobaculia bacterium]
MSRRRVTALLTLAVSAASAPVAPGQRDEAASGPQPPGIRLERVLATRGDLGRGNFLRRLTGQPDPPLFQRPFGVAWDRDTLIVTDPGRGRVVGIGGRGELRHSASDLFSSPIGVASCRAGTLVADSRLGRVLLLDRELRLVRQVAEDLDRPTGVSCDGDRLFVAETGRHRILVFEPGLPVRSLGGRGGGAGEFNFPTVIAPGHGRLWVGDSMNFRIQGLDPETGELASSFGRLGDAPGEMPRLKGLAIDTAGRLWISDAYLEQISIYRQDGAFLTALGGAGNEPGSFSFPAGIASHRDGRVAVVDSLNRRVQIFRWLPTEEEG